MRALIASALLAITLLTLLPNSTFAGIVDRTEVVPNDYQNKQNLGKTLNLLGSSVKKPGAKDLSTPRHVVNIEKPGKLVVKRSAPIQVVSINGTLRAREFSKEDVKRREAAIKAYAVKQKGNKVSAKRRSLVLAEKKFVKRTQKDVTRGRIAAESNSHKLNSKKWKLPQAGELGGSPRLSLKAFAERLSRSTGAAETAVSTQAAGNTTRSLLQASSECAVLASELVSIEQDKDCHQAIFDNTPFDIECNQDSDCGDNLYCQRDALSQYCWPCDRCCSMKYVFEEDAGCGDCACPSPTSCQSSATCGLDTFCDTEPAADLWRVKHVLEATSEAQEASFSLSDGEGKLHEWLITAPDDKQVVINFTCLDAESWTPISIYDDYNAELDMEYSFLAHVYSRWELNYSPFCQGVLSASDNFLYISHDAGNIYHESFTRFTFTYHYAEVVSNTFTAAGAIISGVASCATCGSEDSSTHYQSCVSCPDGYEISVFGTDCTGACVPVGTAEMTTDSGCCATPVDATTSSSGCYTDPGVGVTTFTLTEGGNYNFTAPSGKFPRLNFTDVPYDANLAVELLFYAEGSMYAHFITNYIFNMADKPFFEGKPGTYTLKIQSCGTQSNNPWAISGTVDTARVTTLIPSADLQTLDYTFLGSQTVDDWHPGDAACHAPSGEAMYWRFLLPSGMDALDFFDIHTYEECWYSYCEPLDLLVADSDTDCAAWCKCEEKENEGCAVATGHCVGGLYDNLGKLDEAKCLTKAADSESNLMGGEHRDLECMFLQPDEYDSDWDYEINGRGTNRKACSSHSECPTAFPYCDGHDSYWYGGECISCCACTSEGNCPQEMVDMCTTSYPSVCFPLCEPSPDCDGTKQCPGQYDSDDDDPRSLTDIKDGAALTSHTLALFMKHANAQYLFMCGYSGHSFCGTLHSYQAKRQVHRCSGMPAAADVEFSPPMRTAVQVASAVITRGVPHRRIRMGKLAGLCITQMLSSAKRPNAEVVQLRAGPMLRWLNAEGGLSTGPMLTWMPVRRPNADVAACVPNADVAACV
ncbi:hypothetical protein CYMTET_34251 [Cymbomonas tetramitiformis]|uniref:TNFR-Cys domain-containing protein n=1 Tax=Cymbomonas tetramitiformis TaxID=36881 RepID=A0AAE0FBJ8_9CHLO|nr:hypothetical protein CYMTET_34251 [Cymbomonas tetramitiformis]